MKYVKVNSYTRARPGRGKARSMLRVIKKHRALMLKVLAVLVAAGALAYFGMTRQQLFKLISSKSVQYIRSLIVELKNGGIGGVQQRLLGDVVKILSPTRWAPSVRAVMSSVSSSLTHGGSIYSRAETISPRALFATESVLSRLHYQMKKVADTAIKRINRRRARKGGYDPESVAMSLSTRSRRTPRPSPVSVDSTDYDELSWRMRSNVAWQKMQNDAMSEIWSSPGGPAGTPESPEFIDLTGVSSGSSSRSSSRSRSRTSSPIGFEFSEGLSSPAPFSPRMWDRYHDKILNS